MASTRRLAAWVLLLVLVLVLTGNTTAIDTAVEWMIHNIAAAAVHYAGGSPT